MFASTLTPSCDLGWTGMVIYIAAAFLLGSVPFGYLAGRMCGRDIRKEGSGNIGTTNVFRLLGKGWGTAVFVCDVLKGAVGPWIALHSGWVSAPTGADGLAMLSGLAALLGHNYTPFLNFKGGKGIASSAGVLAALVPLSFLCVLTVWVVTFFLSRMVSLASILAAAALPVSALFFYPGRWLIIGVCLFMGVLAIIRHRANIQRILNGTEHRFGSSPKKTP
jgi:glycerol-3-phosphate acyltransferase PlsY